MFAGIPQSVQNRLRDKHLRLKRRQISVGVAASGNNHDLARAVTDRTKQDVNTDRRCMECGNRNDARRQAPATAHSVPADSIDERTSFLEIMKQQTRLLATGVTIRR